MIKYADIVNGQQPQQQQQWHSHEIDVEPGKFTHMVLGQSNNHPGYSLNWNGASKYYDHYQGNINDRSAQDKEDMHNYYANHKVNSAINDPTHKYHSYNEALGSTVNNYLTTYKGGLDGAVEDAAKKYGRDPNYIASHPGMLYTHLAEESLNHQQPMTKQADIGGFQNQSSNYQNGGQYSSPYQRNQPSNYQNGSQQQNQPQQPIMNNARRGLIRGGLIGGILEGDPVGGMIQGYAIGKWKDMHSKPSTPSNSPTSQYNMPKYSSEEKTEMTETKKANITTMVEYLAEQSPTGRYSVSNDSLTKLAALSDKILDKYRVEDTISKEQAAYFVKCAFEDARYNSLSKQASTKELDIFQDLLTKQAENIETNTTNTGSRLGGVEQPPKFTEEPWRYVKNKLRPEQPIPNSAPTEAPHYSYTTPISHNQTTLGSAGKEAWQSATGKLALGGTALSFGLGMLDPDKSLGENAASTAAWAGGDLAGSYLGAYGSGKFQDWRRSKMTPEDLHREQVHADFEKNRAQQKEINRAREHISTNPDSSKFKYTYNGQNYNGAEDFAKLQNHLNTHQAEVDKFNQLHGHEKPTFMQRMGRSTKGFLGKSLPGMALSMIGGTLASGAVDDYFQNKKLHEHVGEHVGNAVDTAKEYGHAAFSDEPVRNRVQPPPANPDSWR